MFGIRCCYRCKKRNLGCHAYCEHYLREKGKLDEVKQAAKKQRAQIVPFNFQAKNDKDK